MRTETPTFEIERTLWAKGFRHVAGLDEVGRGALAGPVVAGAVIVPPHSQLEGVWAQVRDSKALSAVQRARLEVEIQQSALAWAIGAVDAQEIDRIGIASATRRAMLAAIAALTHAADYLLIDWVRLDHNLPQQNLVKADARIASVAAASILAKVYRDRLMCEQGAYYPAYGFAAHKGYGAASHLQAIAEHGPCPLHRRSFSPFVQPRLL